jgi:hypothetical protein
MSTSIINLHTIRDIERTMKAAVGNFINKDKLRSDYIHAVFVISIN